MNVRRTKSTKIYRTVTPTYLSSFKIPFWITNPNCRKQGLNSRDWWATEGSITVQQHWETWDSSKSGSASSRVNGGEWDNHLVTDSTGYSPYKEDTSQIDVGLRSNKIFQSITIIVSRSCSVHAR